MRQPGWRHLVEPDKRKYRDQRRGGYRRLFAFDCPARGLGSSASADGRKGGSAWRSPSQSVVGNNAWQRMGRARTIAEIDPLCRQDVCAAVSARDCERQGQVGAAVGRRSPLPTRRGACGQPGSLAAQPPATPASRETESQERQTAHPSRRRVPSLAPPRWTRGFSRNTSLRRTAGQVFPLVQAARRTVSLSRTGRGSHRALHTRRRQVQATLEQDTPEPSRRLDRQHLAQCLPPKPWRTRRADMGIISLGLLSTPTRLASSLMACPGWVSSRVRTGKRRSVRLSSCISLAMPG